MKYELLPSEKPGLYRIRALRDFGGVRAGDIGGYVESELNLSHDGDAWVHGGARVYDDARVSGNAHVAGNARVSGNARISGNAWVFGDARVSGNARISDNAQVYGYAQVYGDARVFDNAQVYDDARVFGNAQVFGYANVYGDAEVCGNVQVYDHVRVGGSARVHSGASLCWISGVGSENGTLAAFTTQTGITVTRGCFEGSLDEFEAAVRETHGDSQIAREYALLIEFIRLRLGRALPDEGSI